MYREVWLCLGFQYSQIFILYGVLGSFLHLKSIVFLGVLFSQLVTHGKQRIDGGWAENSQIAKLWQSKFLKT